MGADFSSSRALFIPCGTVSSVLHLILPVKRVRGEKSGKNTSFGGADPGHFGTSQSPSPALCVGPCVLIEPCMRYYVEIIRRCTSPCQGYGNQGYGNSTQVTHFLGWLHLSRPPEVLLANRSRSQLVSRTLFFLHADPFRGRTCGIGHPDGIQAHPDHALSAWHFQRRAPQTRRTAGGQIHPRRLRQRAGIHSPNPGTPQSSVDGLL